MRENGGTSFLLRDRVLQRCVGVQLHNFITFSEYGLLMSVPGVRPMMAVPRIILHTAYQPEERHLLGRMLSDLADLFTSTSFLVVSRSLCSRVCSRTWLKTL